MREMATIANHRAISLKDVGMPVLSVVDDTEEKALMTLTQLGRELEHSAPNHKMSALQDLESGKKLEIEETLGYAVSEALKLDLAVPILDVCYGLIKGINLSNLKTV